MEEICLTRDRWRQVYLGGNGELGTTLNYLVCKRGLRMRSRAKPKSAKAKPVISNRASGSSTQ
jgi:hypothetical protein